MIDSPADLGWLAGLLEGEGTFMLRNSGSGNRPGSVRNCPHVKVAMTDLDIIERVQGIAGFGQVCTSRPSKTGCVMHIWQSSDREFVPDLLRQILPFMGERRAQRIREVLAGAAPFGWDGTRRSLRQAPRVTAVG